MQCGEYVLIEEVSAKEVVENKDNTKIKINNRNTPQKIQKKNHACKKTQPYTVHRNRNGLKLLGE